MFSGVRVNSGAGTHVTYVSLMRLALINLRYWPSGARILQRVSMDGQQQCVMVWSDI